MAGFLEELRRDGEKRGRLFSAVFLVGAFASLPIPTSGRPLSWNMGLVFLWTLSGLLAWSAYFRPAWVVGLWLVTMLMATILYFKHGLLLPAALLGLWALWMGFRSRRLEEEKRGGKVLALALVAIFSANALAQSVPAPEQTYAFPSTPTDAAASAPTAPPAPSGAPAPTTDSGATSTLVDPGGGPADVVIPVKPDEEKKKKEAEKKKEADDALLPPKSIKLNREQEKRRRDAIEDFKRSREDVKRSLPKPGEVKDTKAPIAPAPEPKVEIPKYMAGYTMKDLVSCSVVDRIPWKFRPDQRKTRLLLKDSMRFQSQTRFYDWEFFQVMDRDGFISYIVRRPIAGGRYESIVVKDAAYNRIVDDPKKGPKVVESQDLKNLINRETLVFYHADGSSVSYLPSSIGNSQLTINVVSQNGRQIPPMFLRGAVCDRPSDLRDQDQVQDKILTDRGQPAAAPSGPVK